MSIETGPKFYNVEEEEGKRAKQATVEVSPEMVGNLAAIARRVGGDFNMTVSIGKPGEGSFFNPEDSSITFDPLQIRENPELGEFIAGHEGAHRAITPGPRELGLSEQQIEEHYSQVGFGYLHNVVEDPAVNDWLRQRFPGLNPNVEHVYDEQLEKENAVLGTPEVHKIAMRLGYQPRFAQYGSEIIRDWHQKRFSHSLDPAVKKALDRTIEHARKSIVTIPDPQGYDKKAIKAAAQKRFSINNDYVWPEMQKLVEMDLHTEEQRQMLNDLFRKQQELADKKEQLGQEQSGENKQQLQKDIEQLQKELAPFEQMSEQMRQELKKQMEQALGEALKQLGQEIANSQQQAESAKQEQQRLDKQIKELQEQSNAASGEEKEKLEKQLQELQNQKTTQQAKQRKAEQDLKEAQDIAQQMQDKKSNNPLPFDQLSQDVKDELEKLFKSLPKSKKQEYRNKATEQLEQFEDAINKQYEGKLNEDKPESHHERRTEEQQQQQAETQKQHAQNERKNLEKQLEQLRREKMDDYDKAYEEVAPTVDKTYIKLKRFFLPEVNPRWRKGFSTGQRVDMQRAMQAEADPRNLEKLWERKTIPHKFDYRFVILFDLSQSNNGKKLEESFKGLVTLEEVLEKLGMQHTVIGYSSQTQVFKGWKEKLNKEKRNELAAMKWWGKQATHTDDATNLALEMLEENPGKFEFIINLTDGQPYPPEHGQNLSNILGGLKSNPKVKPVGIGLGPDTEFVKDYYKASLSLPDINPTAQQRREGIKDFSEALADLFEDLIRHPENY